MSLDLVRKESKEKTQSELAPTSMIRVDTGNGHGSTNTTIRRFSNITESVGSDITYADSSTDGNSFTINRDGVYTISYTDLRVAADINMGISLNSANLTTAVHDLTASERLIMMRQTGNDYGSCSVTVRLSASDVIRAHSDGAADSTADAVQFVITQVAKL